MIETSAHAPTIERATQLDDTLVEVDITEIDSFLAGVVEAAGKASKRRLDEHMEAAKSVSGGRGYDFETLVDTGHAKGLGGIAITGVSGMGARPYGMPVLRSRTQFANPYIHRRAVRF